MNKLNFNQTGGFPLSTNILNAMQEAYSVFNSLGHLAGQYAIISGCDEVGNNISDGVIFINGEILPFKGGSKSATIFIKEDTESRIFEDGATKPVIFKRYASFGSSTPDKTYYWDTFRRIFKTTEIEDFKSDFERRLRELETKKSPIPIGLIAIWGKPATEPIPEGWREYEGLRGRFPLGWNPNDADFNTLLKEDGDKEHRLTIDEMPEHRHKMFGGGTYRRHNELGKENFVGVFGETAGNKWNYTMLPAENNSEPVIGNNGKAGNGQPHNNMPPYRIIKFIEFVGF